MSRSEREPLKKKAPPAKVRPPNSNCCGAYEPRSGAGAGGGGGGGGSGAGGGACSTTGGGAGGGV